MADVNSPQTFLRGKVAAFSTIATDQPARARMRAVVDPAGPAPMTRASNTIAGSAFRFGLNERLGRHERMRERAAMPLAQPPAALRWP